MVTLDDLVEEILGDVQDEFDAEISGKELIESGQGNILMLLKDCVLRDRKYANRQEKEEQIGQLKKFAGSEHGTHRDRAVE